MPAVARFLIINAYAAASLAFVFVIAVFGMGISALISGALMAAYALASVLAWLAYVRTYPPRTVTFAHLLMFSSASGVAMFVQGGLWLWGSSLLGPA